MIMDRPLGRLHHHLDSILDSFTGILDCGLKFLHGEGVGMDHGCIELALGHQGHSPMGGAPPFPANPENIDVVTDNMCHILLLG